MFSLLGCQSYNQSVNSQKFKNEYFFLFEDWSNKDTSEIIILAIHGYNDYSNSFKYPAKFLNKFGIRTIAFDLQGFGKNNNRGEWYGLDFHIEDVKKRLEIIKRKNPQKKIFLMGESMGGAIVLSIANLNNNLPIDGVILVAPAVWNFTETNFFKSITMNLVSNIFPGLEISGKGWVDVKASDNLQMLKELSNDQFFIHKPNARSLYGIIRLMDLSYKNAANFLKNPKYDTLLLIPVKDEIIPRKPLLKLLKDENIKKNLNNKIKLGVYNFSYHMMLRDRQGDFISREIKEWVLDKDSILNLKSFENSLKELQKQKFYHILD